MSFLAKINIDDDEMNVLDCTFTFEQGTDYNGRPSQKPKGGQISILLESTGKTNFLEWMISPNMSKKGKITFFKRDNLASLKTVEFTEAYCIKYSENFNSIDSQPLKTRIIISAKKIKIKNTNFINSWPTKM
ncbi:MAG: hypothetical protein L3J23_01950 [Flavobacteriaceae bacterium]|nr:hypothetical protein [Flavobacteriaceae bacterium]